MKHRLREAITELNQGPMDGESSSVHLQRYLNEFVFCYNYRSGLGISDGERTALALKGIAGKRAPYRTVGYKWKRR